MSQKPQASPRPRPRAATRRGAKPKRRRPGCCLEIPVAILLVMLCLAATGVTVLVVAEPLASSAVGQTNLLVAGIDRRGGSGWQFRTDTIMVIGLDPQNRSAAILSIPRDLQVPIPGHGQDRINTANVWGHSKDDPEAGPALLQATIQGNFGIATGGYLMVDFAAFERIVDALGGIEIDVPKTLHDTRYPDPRPGDPHAFKTIHYEAGPQHMDGKQALEYARSRMSTTDFDRAKRQQQVVLALRQKALSPASIPRWPALATAVLDSVKTNLSPQELAGAALTALAIDPDRLKQAVLAPPLVRSHRRADGAAVQLPVWERIDPLVEEMFFPTKP